MRITPQRHRRGTYRLGKSSCLSQSSPEHQPYAAVERVTVLLLNSDETLHPVSPLQPTPKRRARLTYSASSQVYPASQAPGPWQAASLYSATALPGSSSMVETVNWQVVEGDMDRVKTLKALGRRRRGRPGERTREQSKNPLDITSVIYATPLTQSLVTCEKSAQSPNPGIS